MLARPDEAKLSAPGLSLASATSSLSVVAGESGGTIKTSGTEATCVTPENSRTGSNGRFLLRTAATVCPLDVSINVYPSGADFATLAVPGMPGRFSTINCWPQRSPSFSPMMRARRSVTLPAENGTTRRTAWPG